MEQWTNGWIDGLTDVWTDDWTKKWIYGSIDGCAWMKEWADRCGKVVEHEWVEGRMEMKIWMVERTI